MSTTQNTFPEIKYTDLSFPDKILFIGRVLSFSFALYFFLDYILTCQVKTQEGMYVSIFMFIIVIIMFFIIRYDQIKQIFSK